MPTQLIVIVFVDAHNWVLCESTFGDFRNPRENQSVMGFWWYIKPIIKYVFTLCFFSFQVYFGTIIEDDNLPQHNQIVQMVIYVNKLSLVTKCDNYFLSKAIGCKI